MFCFCIYLLLFLCNRINTQNTLHLLCVLYGYTRKVTMDKIYNYQENYLEIQNRWESKYIRFQACRGMEGFLCNFSPICTIFCFSAWQQREILLESTNMSIALAQTGNTRLQIFSITLLWIFCERMFFCVFIKVERRRRKITKIYGILLKYQFHSLCVFSILGGYLLGSSKIVFFFI